MFSERQPKYKQFAVEEDSCTYGDGNFHTFPFFKILQENKPIRQSYEDYFINKFKPFVSKKT